MSDPLSLAASLAGLVSLCDTVCRHVYKYVRGVKGAKEEITKIAQELQSFTGILWSIQVLAQSLEEDGDLYDPAIRVHHVYHCEQTLNKVNERMKRALQKVEKGRSMGGVMQQLKWPFSKTETQEVLEELERHKNNMNLGIGTDSMHKMQMLLSKQKETDTVTVETRRVVREIRTEILVDAKKRQVLEFFMDTEKVNPQTSLDSNIKMRHPMTGLWLTESPVFIQWLATPGSKIWLRGIPGGGKTVLAGAVIQETLTHAFQNPSIGAAFFFCDYRNEATLKSANVLGALVSQLARQKDAAFDLLQKYYDELHPAESLPKKADSDDLRALAGKMCEQFDRVLVVIDGVDECGNSMDEVAEALSDLASTTNTISMAIFSRDDAAIGRQIGDDFKPISIEARSRDIELYVRAELESLMKRGRLRVTNAKLKDDIRETLVDQAQGMFRWVTCQLDYLCGFSSDFERRNALGELPPTLHETYLRLLQRVTAMPSSTQSKIQMCLHFIAFSPLRLTINDLRSTISTPDGIGASLDDDNMVSEEDIAFMCGSLLRKTDDGVFFEFAHFSVREFLEHESLAGTSGLNMYQISRERSNEMLAVQCLRFLQLSNFDVQFHDSESLANHVLDARVALHEDPVIEFQGRAAVLSVQLSKLVQSDATSANLMKSLFHPCRSSCFLLFATRLCFDLIKRFESNGLLQTRGVLRYRILAKQLLHSNFQPIHLAAALNLPDVCHYLIDAGSDLEADSMLGTPLELSATSFLRILLTDGHPMLIEKYHRHLYRPIYTLLGTRHQRNATFAIFEHTPFKPHTSVSRRTSLAVPIGLQALVIAFAHNSFLILQKLLSRGMTLEDTIYTTLLPELMYQASPDIQSNEEPLLSFLQCIGSRLGAETGWPLEVGRVIWNTAVELELHFTLDPTMIDSRISLSKDALVSRAFATIKRHDMDGLLACLADGRLDLSERHRHPLESQDKHDPLHLTLLHFAVMEGNIGATKVLTQTGCDPNIPAVQSDQRFLPVHDCFRLEILEELSLYGTSVTDVETSTGQNMWHFYGSTPEPEINFFDSVAKRYPSETAEALLMKSRYGHTPLELLLGSRHLNISHEDHIERVMALLATCQGVVGFWSRHGPILGAAAAFGSEKVNRRLIEVVGGSEILTPGLETPLHRISIESSSTSVQSLKEVFPEAVHIRIEDQLPLQAYLKKCLHENHPIDDSVVQQLETAEALESIDGRGTSLWEYYCTFNTTYWSTSNKLNNPILWTWLLGKSFAMQVYEKGSGKSGLVLILSRLTISDQIEDLASAIPQHALKHAIDATDRWETIKSDSNVLRFLQFAMKNRAYSLVSLLVERGVSVHDQVDGYSSFQIAFQSPLVVSLYSEDEGQHMLLEMVDHATHKQLNGYDRDGLTILHTLATRDSDGGQGLQWLVIILVLKGVDINRLGKFQDKRTPMAYHLGRESVACATCLLEVGADPELAQEPYANAALEASVQGSVTFLRELLDHSKKSGMQLDWEQKTGFSMRSRKDSRAVYELYGANAIHYASAGGSLEVLEWYVHNGLIDNLETASAQGWTAMHCAAFCGNASTIEYLVSKGCHTMPETENKATPLHMSVGEGHYEATKILIRLGAKDIPDIDGMTPTMYASRVNNKSILQLLSELSTFEASLAYESARGPLSRHRFKALTTALESAVQSGDVKECQRLYSIGCPLEVSIKGCSPLFLALNGGHLDMAEWLLDNGANTTARIGQGIAAEPNINVIDVCLRHSKLCKLLPKLVDQVIHDGSGWPLFGSSSFWGAIKSCNAEGLSTLFELLRDKAADISAVSNVSATEVLHRTVNRAFLLNIRTGHGTALHYAALEDNVPAARLLLENGAVIDTPSSGQRTALGMSTSPEMITLLVHHGASLAHHFFYRGFGYLRWPIPLFRSLVSAYSELETEQDQLGTIPAFLPKIFDTRGNIPCDELIMSPDHIMAFLKAGLDSTGLSRSEMSPMHLAILNESSSTFLLNSDLGFEDTRPFPWHLFSWSDPSFLGSMFRHFKRKLKDEDFVRIAHLQPARGWSPLCIAARGHERLLRNCLSLGADVDFEGSPHGSALVLACALGSLGAVRILVRAGASLSYQGQNGDENVFTFCRSKDVRRWLLIERFTEQGRIYMRPHWENRERIRPSAGTAIVRLKLVGDRAMCYHEARIDYAVRLARMRKEWRGNVIPAVCIDDIVYKS